MIETIFLSCGRSSEPVNMSTEILSFTMLSAGFFSVGATKRKLRVRRRKFMESSMRGGTCWAASSLVITSLSCGGLMWSVEPVEGLERVSFNMTLSMIGSLKITLIRRTPNQKRKTFWTSCFSSRRNLISVETTSKRSLWYM